MLSDLTPSPRAHGAQRILASTTLVCEALVVLFGSLVAHGLYPDTRAWSWGLGLSLVLLLALLPGFMRSRSAWPYWAGFAVQLGVLAYAAIVPAMAVVGLGFGIIYGIGVVKGRRIDMDKDRIDREYRERDSDPSRPPRSGEHTPGTVQ